MKIIGLGCLLFLLFSCHQKTKQKGVETNNEITIAFGSCNNQHLPNHLWKEIAKSNPDVFIWGGDIIYSDTEEMSVMQQNYTLQKQDTAYQNFIKNRDVLGTWDDHDYGMNDGGNQYAKKDSVQQFFLDFFDVPKDSPRRQQKGIYFSKDYKIDNNSLKIIVLDTRFFRDDLTPDTTGVKRYLPNYKSSATMLGQQQWAWLKKELYSSKANFNIIVSSIQFLSNQHGFESWGNLPLETQKMKNLIINSKAKGVIFLSGDRHIAEISKDTLARLPYPLIDVTSSGLTHSYTSFKEEPNPYRISKVINQKNFGIINCNVKENSVQIEIRGEQNKLFASYNQKY